MPPPTTLTGYYTEASTYADTAVTSLQAKATQANAGLATAQAALATATSKLAADQQANAALRVSLSQAALPSDASNLVAGLQQNMIQTRIDQAAVGTATDRAGTATRAQQAAAAALAAAQQAQQQATAALTASQANDAEIAQWTQAVNGPSVTGALAAVNDPSVATSLSDAGSALEAIIGTGMLQLFRQRRDDFLASAIAGTASVATAFGAQNALQAAHQPLLAAVHQAEAAYTADLQELQDLATKAVADIDSALAALTSAVNVGSLPASEQQPITAAAPAALAQVPAEKAVFAAKTQLRTDQASLDSIAFAAYGSNPDFDPETDPSAAAARTAIANDETALATAAATLAAGQADIDNWQVLIPEAVMQLVVAVTEAETTIAGYQAVSVSTLLTDLAAKESAYAGALDARLTYQRSSALIADKLSWRQGTVAAAAQVAPARENAAIRGAL
jgi:trimeric autotransporter adhesin